MLEKTYLHIETKKALSERIWPKGVSYSLDNYQEYCKLIACLQPGIRPS